MTMRAERPIAKTKNHFSDLWDLTKSENSS
jgi:hypothetical protein